MEWLQYNLEEDDELVVDPSKAETFSQSRQSTQMVCGYIQTIISNVIDAHEAMSLDAKKMCRFFYLKAGEISDRTEEPPEFVAAGMIKTFMFTRLVVPALKSPHRFGLADSPPPPHVQSSLDELARIFRLTIINTPIQQQWATKINLMMEGVQPDIDGHVTLLMQEPEGFSPPVGCSWNAVQANLPKLYGNEDEGGDRERERERERERADNRMMIRVREREKERGSE
eukprot:TRINITY_DN3681_c2_g1_i17.p1 TRINITY_DN3681_c2_g1~~TRINITY_DN3681_c2_g1_i17.p1  ORF type:complete len:227 (+),score=69.48 TRINITY_DN3681_c2_g1_i17:197-877(+)